MFKSKWDLTTMVAGSDVPSRWVGNDFLSSVSTEGFDGMKDSCSADYNQDGVADTTDCDYVHWE